MLYCTYSLIHTAMSVLGCHYNHEKLSSSQSSPSTASLKAQEARNERKRVYIMMNFKCFELFNVVSDHKFNLEFEKVFCCIFSDETARYVHCLYCHIKENEYK